MNAGTVQCPFAGTLDRACVSVRFIAEKTEERRTRRKRVQMSSVPALAAAYRFSIAAQLTTFHQALR